MTPGELVHLIAAVTRTPDSSVSAYYRALREADMVSRGGRGRSSVQSTLSDAGRLLLATMTVGTAPDAPRTVAALGGLPQKVKKDASWPNASNFEAAIVELLSSQGVGSTNFASITVAVELRSLTARIELDGQRFDFGAPADGPDFATAARAAVDQVRGRVVGPESGIRIEVWVGKAEIVQISQAF